MICSLAVKKDLEILSAEVLFHYFPVVRSIHVPTRRTGFLDRKFKERLVSSGLRNEGREQLINRGELCGDEDRARPALFPCMRRATGAGVTVVSIAAPAGASLIQREDICYYAWALAIPRL